MKRMNFLPMGAAALLLAFVACTDEVAEVPAGELKQIVMTASDFETENGSRTNFQITSSGAEFSWAANDTVGIFPNEGAQAYFPMTSGAGTKSANFTGGGWALKDASTYAAYYPFIGNFYLDKNAIPVDYTGQVQTGDASTAHLGAYDYMAAAPSTPKNGNVVFAFKHLGALVQLKLTVPQATTLNSVTLTTESKVFAVEGKVNIMANTLGITSVTSSKELTLEVKNVTTTKANQVVTLYMMIPPVDLSNNTLKAVVKTSAGSEEVALDSKNFLAGKAYALSGSLKDPNGGAIAGNGTYKDGVVSIATAGTMKKLLGDDYLNITSLKVVGPINGDDIYYLAKMLGRVDFSAADWGKLTTLDLSEAIIVAGGEWYYDSSTSTGGEYYTSNNEIGDYMFYGCANLQNITLPDNVTSIGDKAFYKCDDLTGVTIGDSVTSIGNSAFFSCDALTIVTIGDGATLIGSSAFEDCDALTEVVIEGNGVTSIGNKAFSHCDALTEVVIEGNGVTSIGEQAFSDCDALTEVTIPDGVTSIGDQAFYGCDALTEVTIGDDVTSIGGSAFFFCDALTKVTIKDLSSWCKIEFEYSYSNPLENGVKLYLNDKEITQLVIPETISTIKEHAFYGCKSITSVTIHDGVTSIGDDAFRSCDALTKVTIGNGVTSIGEAAFESCGTLTEIIIGKSIEGIESKAFTGCPINALYCYATEPPTIEYHETFNRYTFGGIETGATLYVPTRCGAAYKSSYWGRYFNNIIEMD